jgi:hypothetical protein
VLTARRRYFFPLRETLALRGELLGATPQGGAWLNAAKPWTLSSDAQVRPSELRAVLRYTIDTRTANTLRRSVAGS